MTTPFYRLHAPPRAGDDELFYEAAAVYLGRMAYVDHLLGLLMDGLSAR